MYIRVDDDDAEKCTKDCRLPVKGGTGVLVWGAAMLCRYERCAFGGCEPEICGWCGYFGGGCCPGARLPSPVCWLKMEREREICGRSISVPVMILLTRIRTSETRLLVALVAVLPAATLAIPAGTVPMLRPSASRRWLTVTDGHSTRWWWHLRRRALRMRGRHLMVG